VFEAALAEAGGCVKAIRVPQGSRISNSRLKAPKGDVAAEAVAAGVRVLVGEACIHASMLEASRQRGISTCATSQQHTPPHPSVLTPLGAAGLAFLRVLADGAIDAAKPIKEGLTQQQVAAVLDATQAQEV
jgi:aspartyl-tRNA synthetase